MLAFWNMSTEKKSKAVREDKAISILLNSDDQDCLDRIAKEYGLIKYTDCLRLAVREAVRNIEAQQPTAA
jgi:hypothetical protein